MSELKIIENKLVPVYETSTGEKVVNGRELWTVLESKQDFSTWVKKRLFECDAVENNDFDCLHKKMEANNATMIEYIIKLDIAKEMAMLERNDIGKRVRKYFIDVEKRYKSDIFTGLSTEMKALLMQDKKIQAVEKKVDKVDSDLQDFKQDITLLGIECEVITNAVKAKGVKLLGGKDSPAYHDKSVRGKVYSDIYNEIKRQFGVSSYKALKRNQSDIAIKIVEAYELPLVLKDLIEITNENVFCQN